MGAYDDRDRVSNTGSSGLEAEVAAWLKRRAVRPSATSGTVRVVRIPKRARPRGSPSARTSDSKPVMA
jgi:hypothetical protein